MAQPFLLIDKDTRRAYGNQTVFNHCKALRPEYRVTRQIRDLLGGAPVTSLRWEKEAQEGEVVDSHYRPRPVL